MCLKATAFPHGREVLVMTILSTGSRQAFRQAQDKPQPAGERYCAGVGGWGLYESKRIVVTSEKPQDVLS